ncbi:hypothetical protein TGAMA5MH_06956 [Trichoderma gamsii]|uniref:BZIP transcription factor n=1 Tax=Trichoderma gamsii TaxID=398673 RepID=A0A2K0T6D7_9HYPO|nr:hypothetical protein TGAMA5MH_06956 [Trichoderma gamsii]
MDTRSARRGRSSPVVGDSVESASPSAIEAIKPESSVTASPLASSTAVNLNGTAGAGAGASEPMETTETDEAETVTKKRKTGTGSRGVANLTPEQLAKKRANDREAQRAIRERTKNQIERLEKRIRELENQKPYQDLQVVVRAKEAIEAENAEIKRRLATIITMLQPIVGTGDPGVASTLSSAAVPTAVPVTSSVPYHPAAPAGGVADPQRQPAQPPLQSWSSAGSSSSPPPHRAGLAGAVDESTRLMLEQQGHSLRHGLDFGSGRFDFNVVLDPIQAIPKLQRGRDGAQDTGEFHHVAMKHDWTQVSQENARPTWESPLAIPSPGSDPASGILPKAVTSQPASSSGLGLDGTAPNIPPVPFPDAQAANIAESLPLWARPLRNCEPTCPLDALLLDFRSERQQRAAEGYEQNEVTGPRYPSVSSLLNPANSKYSHPVSKVFTDIVGKFPEISGLPEKVTILYLMFIYMRWQISPTKENYERLPEWFRPLPCQLDIPHPAWMDYLPYPEMRERVILANDPSIFYFDNWFLPFTSTFTISWPYEEAHTLLRNPDSDEIMINPVFESHMRNLDNWKVGRAFAEAFPMLVDTCKFWDGTNQQQGPE